MSVPFTSHDYPPIDIWKEPWISATQISTFELCNRKWAWRWLERIYAEPNKFALLGIRTHGKLEKWLKYSEVPSGSSKEVLLAQAMIPYLPPPQAVDYFKLWNVERDELIVVQDVLFNIKVDLFMPEQLSWDGTVRPRTYDHKTTGDFKWCPKPNEIQYDPQAALYAAWTIIQTKETTIDLQWNYVRTKGAIKVEPIYATVTDEMITPRMRANVETGRAIKHHIANTKRALDVAPDWRACDEYGGCPYKDRCGITAKERIVAIMSDFKNQPATQQFMQGLGPGHNGAAVNPPQFQPPQQPQFQPPQQPSFQPPQQPQFQAPAGQQFAAPMPQQSAPQFQAAQVQVPQPNFAVSPAGPPQQAFAPPQQPAFQPPQQMQLAPPPQQAPQQFAPPQQPPQVTPAQQFVPPQQQAAAPAAEKGPGRPKQSKEHDMTGAWATIMAGAIQLTGGNVAQAAQLADQAIVELRARQ